ncbi:hypothetical protein [Tanticharoenia sakaeratensis]|uniref:Uncharacterized protein n=1 Tax=Tanticharoenia sakaeratensis NBRC 103193 TaxID=1231623 RepID=A0A0D6MNF7_9PROT|nr:hypothetical protein [Tanticharoenia sakaeratensis]GAN55232.1 hypothetical protein Tasa_041_027 [Tanticharoenia sakaeratensis NBRC 103193]GBQ23308.1 hypothetical protein AA103193_2370 [Tanticharoenia sakaeratensis NBRC 103193]
MLRRLLRERRAMDATALLNENARLKAENARFLDHELAHRTRIAALERALADTRAQLRAEDRVRDRAGRFS